MDRGYLKLYRCIEDSGLLQDNTPILRVFIHLLITASYKERKTLIGGNEVILCPGQLVTGRKRIAEALDISEKQVRTALNKLEKNGTITQQPSNKASIITILNFSQYQSEKDAKQGQQRASESPYTPTETSDQTTEQGQQRANKGPAEGH